MITAEITRMGELDYHASEAINTLCTNLSFVGGDVKKIMITSCHPQEGKSFVSMHLLRALSSLGLRTVLVDADIRASGLKGTYGIEISIDQGRYRGLSGYLAGKCEKEEILIQTDMSNAYMILAGKTVSKSFALINKPRMKELLEQLTDEFDIMLVDSPPIGVIIDAAKLAAWCDTTLFVVKCGEVSGEELRSAVLQIQKAGCDMVGYVMNKADHIHNKKYYGRYMKTKRKR